MLAFSNLDVLKATLRRLRSFKMTRPLLQVLKKPLAILLSLCHMQYKML